MGCKATRTETGRRIRLHLASRRGAPIVLLVLPPGVEVSGLSVGGVAAPARAPKTRAWHAGWLLTGCATTPAEGVDVDLVVSGAEPFEAVVVDESLGLPRTAASLLAARPRSGVPSWDGDMTIATARVRL